MNYLSGGQLDVSGLWGINDEVFRLVSDILLTQYSITEQELQGRLILELMQQYYSDIVLIAKKHREIPDKIINSLSNFIEKEGISNEERKTALKYIVNLSSEDLDELEKTFKTNIEK